MYNFIYNENTNTILIKLSRKGFWIGVLAMLVAMGGAGIALICMHDTIWQLFGGIIALIGYCVFLPLYTWEYKNSRVVMTGDGIWYRTIKQNKRFLWEDCKFVGEWRSGARYAGADLALCRQAVQRDTKGRIPQGYPWPEEDTILMDEWGSLTDEQKQQILALCGGPRG